MTPIWVSYATTRYNLLLETLRGSLLRFRLDHDLHRIGRVGPRWLQNARHKPRFILEMLERHEGRPVVWIDADAEVVQWPELLLPAKAEVAGAIFGWPGKPTEIENATLWFRNGPDSRRLVLEWIAVQDKNEEGRSQKCFQIAYKRIRPEFQEIPLSYCYCPRLHGRVVKTEPVILQHMHSLVVEHSEA